MRLVAKLERLDKQFSRQAPARKATKVDVYAAFQAKYWNDPAGFVRDCIAWRPGEMPAPYQLEILSAVPERRRVAAIGPHGLGKCLAYNEAMRLADGRLVPAKDLIGQTFEVLAVDSEMRVHKAQAVAWDNGMRDVVRITTDKGRVIERTLNHPLWADLEPRRWAKPEYAIRMRPEGGWIDAGDLKPGAVVAIYAGNSVTEPYPLSDAEIKIVAYLIGDGDTTGSTPTFSCGNDAHLEDMRAACDGLDCQLKVQTTNRFDYRISNKQRGRKHGRVAMLIKDSGLFGRDCFNKRFPEWVWQLDDRQLALFLSRLYATDGWAHGSRRKDGKVNKEIGYATVCRGLADDVARALLRLGIQAEVRAKKTSWTYKGELKRSSAYCVNIHDAASIVDFCQRVGIFGKEPAVNKLLELCLNASDKEQQKWRTFNLPENMRWEKVKSVEMMPAQPTVGITVPGYETFLTDFVEHNSTLSAWLILWYALTRDGRDWKIATTASAWRQLTEYLWPEVHKWARRLDWEKVGRPALIEKQELLTLTLNLRTGSAFALASDKPSSIEGAHADHLLYLFDESKAIPDEIFDSAEGAFSTPGEIFVVAVSTPGDRVGRFFNIHTDRIKYAAWWTRHVTLEECVAAGRVSVEWADLRRHEWGEDSAEYQNRVLGKFAESEQEDGVIPRKWVKLAQERWRATHEQIVSGRRPMSPFTCLGIDVGGEKQTGDRTVMASRHGYFIDELITIRGENPMQIAGRASAIMRMRSGYAVVDTIGIGAGVAARLRQMGHEVYSFGAGEGTDKTDSTKELAFLNLRAYAWWRMREMLDPTAGAFLCLPPDQELEDELCAPTYDRTKSDKIVIEDKDKLREKLGRSPDKADAVIMSMMDYTAPRKPTKGRPIAIPMG